MSNKKRGQHYVWRKYLEAWSTDEQIWCYRDKKIFHTNLKNVGRQRDFYKPNLLTQDEVRIIKTYLIEPMDSDLLKRLNMGWLDNFEQISEIQRFVERRRQLTSNPDKEIIQLFDALEVSLHNSEENFHSNIESDAKNYLASSINEDLSFFERDKDHIGFLIYICLQYFRTKKIKDLTPDINDFFGFKFMNMENFVAFLRLYGATNVGASIYREKGLWKLVLLRNQSDVPFITCDQPVTNTYAFGKPVDTQVDDLAFYYPITPKLALLVTQDKRYSHTDASDVDEMEVNTYNAIAVNASHEQMYSNDEQVLKDLLTVIRRFKNA